MLGWITLTPVSSTFLGGNSSVHWSWSPGWKASMFIGMAKMNRWNWVLPAISLMFCTSATYYLWVLNTGVIWCWFSTRDECAGKANPLQRPNLIYNNLSAYCWQRCKLIPEKKPSLSRETLANHWIMKWEYSGAIGLAEAFDPWEKAWTL